MSGNTNSFEYMSDWQTGWDEYATDKITFNDMSYPVHRDIMIMAFRAWMIIGKTGSVCLEPAMPLISPQVILDLLNDVYKLRPNSNSTFEHAEHTEEAFELSLGKACLAEFLGANDWLRMGLLLKAKQQAMHRYQTSRQTRHEDPQEFYRELNLIHVMQSTNLTPEIEDIDAWQMKPWVNLGNSSKDVMLACREMVASREDDDAETIRAFLDNCLKVLEMPCQELHSVGNVGFIGLLVYAGPDYYVENHEKPVYNVVCHILDRSSTTIRRCWGLGNALSEFHRAFYKTTTDGIEDTRPPCLQWFWWSQSSSS